ncbi:Uncharacterised protein [Mycobacteroides abscessus]|nr:Uncharacterised protein [Mycobacteroides abscessus]
MAAVSPENAGPSRPSTLASPTICGATWVAFCGSPSVSNGLSVTWQPGFASLNASTATWAPYWMLSPSAAFGPVRAPATAIEVPSAHSALPSPAGSTGLPAAVASTSAPSMSIWTDGTMLRSAEPPPSSVSVDVPVVSSSPPPWDWGPQAVRTRVAARSRAAPPLARRAVRCMPTSVVLIPAEAAKPPLSAVDR